MLRPLLISTLVLVGLLAASTTSASAVNCVQIASSARITIIPCPTPTPTLGGTVAAQAQAQPAAATVPGIPDPATYSDIKPPVTGEGSTGEGVGGTLGLIGWLGGSVVLLGLVIGTALAKPRQP